MLKLLILQFVQFEIFWKAKLQNLLLKVFVFICL